MSAKIDNKFNEIILEIADLMDAVDEAARDLDGLPQDLTAQKEALIKHCKGLK